MLREPQHERNNSRLLQIFSVRPERRRRTPTKFSQKLRGASMRVIRAFRCYSSLLSFLFLFNSLCFAQSTPALRPYDGLKGKEREQKLMEGAKKEGKVVVYSFTAVDQLKPLLDEFQKKYTFITPE